MLATHGQQEELLRVWMAAAAEVNRAAGNGPLPPDTSEQMKEPEGMRGDTWRGTGGDRARWSRPVDPGHSGRS